MQLGQRFGLRGMKAWRSARRARVIEERPQKRYLFFYRAYFCPFPSFPILFRLSCYWKRFLRFLRFATFLFVCLVNGNISCLSTHAVTFAESSCYMNTSPFRIVTDSSVLSPQSVSQRFCSWLSSGDSWVFVGKAPGLLHQQHKAFPPVP